MRKYDIVYILRDNVAPDELRYSLRSIEANMDHGKVFFYCGKPDGLIPDVHIDKPQRGANKWERVRSSLLEVCRNDKITKQFWLFNDDFYVLAPMEKAIVYHRGLLHDHALDIEQRHGGQRTAYTTQLRNCEDQLRQAGLTSLDYALHVPMLIDRAKMLEALEMFPRCPMFRSLYGNYAQIGGEFHRDVKTVNPDYEIAEDADLFSTSNRSFAGSVREQLEKRFPDPCRYEVEYGEGVCS